MTHEVSSRAKQVKKTRFVKDMNVTSKKTTTHTKIIHSLLQMYAM